MLTGIHGPEVCRLHTQRKRLRQILSKIRENDLSAAKSTKINAKQDNTCFLTVKNELSHSKRFYQENLLEDLNAKRRKHIRSVSSLFYWFSCFVFLVFRSTPSSTGSVDSCIYFRFLSVLHSPIQSSYVLFNKIC